MQNLTTISRPNNLRHLPYELRRARLKAAREYPWQSVIRAGIRCGAWDGGSVVRKYLEGGESG